MKYYMVTQMNHGAEHRWIYDERTISEEVYHGGPVPDEDSDIPYWPIGGSNCGYADILKASSEEEMRQFLTTPGDGAAGEYDDPMLVDIGEYYYTAGYCWNYDASCTDKFMEKLGLTYKDVSGGDPDYEFVEEMVEALKKAGYADFDYEDPFYGNNSDMRYSELYDLYERVCKNAG